ncbi:MAG: arginine--tRNA ligase [Pirellulales bacterium]|nr:arginine--tRNA ligase [Pirellulales bacterium]
MNLAELISDRLTVAASRLSAEPGDLASQVRQAQDPKFGDYQINCAMSLGKRLGRPPREVAAELVAALDLGDCCEPPEIAGPGFINLRFRQEWLAARLAEAVADERLGIALAARPRTYVVDYSAPNVAKPMHVGHIRSTVIGDALVRTLRFLGHRVISDNHLGDWGTQFGMILYGYRNFLDAPAYQARPVDELSRLYRLVSRLVDYHERRAARSELVAKVTRAAAELAGAERAAQAAAADPKQTKAAGKQLAKAQAGLREAEAALAETDDKLAAIDHDSQLAALAREHAEIGAAVLRETALLHAGDPERRRLWSEFLPKCLVDLDVIYRRLGVTFDYTLGESFYHDRLAGVVAELERLGLARASEGAVCVFVEGYDAPMIIQKQDGAFLYATTDLATLQYRLETWRPDAILYVVDHRQSLHFEQLFATARRWGMQDVELVHVSFGTILGKDGRPYRTRAGDTVGLAWLLDEAVEAARDVVGSGEGGRELAPADRERVAEVVGIAALKYADLSQNRTSDYVFDREKMVSLDGNTATYMQYAYARVQSIFARGQVDADALRRGDAKIVLDAPAERQLALAVLRFAEALALAMSDYRPSQLTAYLWELANCYSAFFEACPVLKAETPELRTSRLLLCDLTARTLCTGLALLGIEVVERM